MSVPFEFDASAHAAHLSDDDLLALTLAEPVAEGVARHLARCSHCAARREAVAAELGGVERWLLEAADAQLSPARLERQAASIARRLSGAARPARVLRFPSPSRVLHAAERVGRGWIAAAAVAGLLVGVLTGRSLDPLALQSGSRGDTAARFAPAHQVGSSWSGALADEALLIEIDQAIGAPRIEPLATLDAITPQTYDLPPGY